MRLDDLAALYGFSPGAAEQLGCLADLLVRDSLAPTAIRSERGVLEGHLADSLVALDLEFVRAAETTLDLGSGAGLPGLPLAIALPGTSFTLLESSSRKCNFLRRAVDACRVTNANVVHGRAESFEAGREAYDLVTVRAVAALPVIAEYAAPLLRVGGCLLAWQGRRDPGAEAALDVAAGQLGLEPATVWPVSPYPTAAHRHLYGLRKVQETPPRFPRRPGMALKRPLGAGIPPDRAPSDRIQR